MRGFRLLFQSSLDDNETPFTWSAVSSQTPSRGSSSSSGISIPSGAVVPIVVVVLAVIAFGISIAKKKSAANRARYGSHLFSSPNLKLDY